MPRLGVWVLFCVGAIFYVCFKGVAKVVSVLEPNMLTGSVKIKLRVQCAIDVL